MRFLIVRLRKCSGLKIASYAMRSPLSPRMEGALDALHERRDSREVPRQQVDHARLLNPVDTLPRVDLRSIVARQEAIALEAPRGHQEKDAKRGIAEPEALRQRLGHQADVCIDLFEVVVVDPANLLGPLRVVRQLFERRHRGLVKQAAELLYRGTPRSRSRRMSIVPRSNCSPLSLTSICRCFGKLWSRMAPGYAVPNEYRRSSALNCSRILRPRFPDMSGSVN